MKTISALIICLACSHVLAQKQSTGTSPGLIQSGQALRPGAAATPTPGLQRPVTSPVQPPSPGLQRPVTSPVQPPAASVSTESPFAQGTNQTRVETNASIGVSGVVGGVSGAAGVNPTITEPSGATRQGVAGQTGQTGALGTQLDRTFTREVAHAVTIGGTHSLFAPISGSVITVTTDNGVTTLQGTVRNADERESIEARLNALNIRSVDNQLQVVPRSTSTPGIQGTTTNQLPAQPLP